MKFVTVAVAALASVAAAWPYERECKPATYRCEHSLRGWDVCSTSGQWVNGSPYCLPPRHHHLYPEEEFEI
ncbi:hypothetical protein E5D57_003035 [Metarhizium anisopliae]|nr:hypothetical protein E5D57_003035 [Metarhizium anisopliae]